MKYIKTYEKVKNKINIEPHKYKIGNYILLTPKCSNFIGGFSPWTYDRYAKITNNGYGPTPTDKWYQIETYLTQDIPYPKDGEMKYFYKGEMTHPGVTEDQIMKKITKKEYDEHILNVKTNNYNL